MIPVVFEIRGVLIVIVCDVFVSFFDARVLPVPDTTRSVSPFPLLIVAVIFRAGPTFETAADAVLVIPALPSSIATTKIPLSFFHFDAIVCPFSNSSQIIHN